MYAPRATTREHRGQLVFYLNPALAQPSDVMSSVVLLKFSADSESNGLTVAALPSRSIHSGPPQTIPIGQKKTPKQRKIRIKQNSSKECAGDPLRVIFGYRAGSKTPWAHETLFEDTKQSQATTEFESHYFLSAVRQGDIFYIF